MASSGASAMPSQREGSTTRSAAWYQGAASVTAPVNSTDFGALARSGPPSGPSPTSTRRAPGTRSTTVVQARSSRSCPFCRHSRPTHTTSGAAGSTSGSSPARTVPTAAGWKRSGSMPLGITVYRPWIPARTPVSRSASLTHTTRAAQRAALRSQLSASAAMPPPTASNDQACGWNTVGIRPRSASRPARPALALCACTRSGRTSSISRLSSRTSRTSVGPGVRVADQARTLAPSAPSSALRALCGQPTVTWRPAASWARARSVTTRATPPSTGWVRCRTRGGGSVADRCIARFPRSRVSLRDGRDHASAPGVDGGQQHAGPHCVPLGNEPEARLVTMRGRTLRRSRPR